MASVGGADDQMIILWDARSRNLVRQWRWPIDSPYLSFSPDGSQLFSAGNGDGSINVWDPTSGNLVTTLQPPATAISSTSTPLTTSDEDEETSDADPAPSMDESVDITRACCAIAWSTSTLASADRSGSVCLWDVHNYLPQHTLTTDSSSAASVLHLSKILFSPDGRWLVGLFGYSPGFGFVWEVATGSLHMTFGDIGISAERLEAKAIAFDTRDNTVVAVGRSGTILRWNVETKELVSRIILDESSGIRIAALSGDGGLVCWTSRARREILAISSVGGEVSRHMHRGEISRISLSSPSEEYVVVSSNECATSIWRVKDRQLVLSDGRPGNVFSVVDGALSENEQVYVTGTSHGTIRITTMCEQLVNEC